MEGLKLTFKSINYHNVAHSGPIWGSRELLSTIKEEIYEYFFK